MMFILRIFAFLLLYISSTFSAPNALDTNAGSISSTTPDPSSGLTSALNTYTFYVANEFIAPDGYNRSATLVNGVFPGPLIQGNKGDNFSIQVFNELTDPSMYLETSIHWHGIFEKKANWADGTPSVTQCPILQGANFNYELTVAGQSGTFWYHSHYSTQYCDGLRGAFVVYDPEDPLAYMYDVDDANTVITLSDWYHAPSILTSDIPGGVTSNATLINGLGRYAGGPPTPFAVINVQQGLRYRFRVIATSCDPSFNFSIDGHRMTIIEADGNGVVPVEVDSVPVYAGQRYSLVVTANQSVGNFWIRALSSVSTDVMFQGGQNLAILRYEGAPNEDPTSQPGPYELGYDEAVLHPLINPAAPGIPEIGKADVSIQLAPSVNTTNSYFMINNVTYYPPNVPVLLQILSGAKHPSQLMPQGSVYVLPSNKVIELNFPNPVAAPGSPHPIHLHGQAFSVVKHAGSNATNFVNPVRRDVVSIGNLTTDNVTIRFTTDNAGPWLLHCHIDWHINHGFGVVMAVAPPLTVEEESPLVPEEWFRLCPSGQTQK